MIELNSTLEEDIKTNYSNKNIINIFVSNISSDSSKNVDTILYDSIVSTQNTIYIEGNYDGFTGYLAVNHEVIKVLSSSYNGSYTSCEVVRGMYKTYPNTHFKNNIIRSVEYLPNTTNVTVRKQSDVASNDLFKPVLTSSRITIYDEDISKWNTWSNTNEYNVSINKYVYIYVGFGNYCVRESTGYITEFYTSSKDKQAIIEFSSKLNLYYEKNINTVASYKNIDLISFFHYVLDIPLNMIKYADYNNSDDFTNIDYITLKDYETYGDLIVFLCKAKNIRISFDSLENLVISSTIKKTNINNYATENVSLRDLADIDTNTEKALIINNVTCNFLERKPLKNRADFIITKTDWILNEAYWEDGGSWIDDEVWYDDIGSIPDYYNRLKHIRPFKFSSVFAEILNEESWNEFNIYLAEDIKYFQIGNYIIIKDIVTGMEFVTAVTNINTSTNEVTVICGFDKDKEVDYKGKINYLYANGFADTRQYNVYYNIIEMPFVWALNINDSSDDLKVPILPQETISYAGQFGTATSGDTEFSGIVEEINNIYGTFDNTTLKYNQDISQNVPLYIQTNKVDKIGTDESEYWVYKSFDNSNITVNVEEDSTGENDFIVEISNTMTVSNTSTETPLSVSLSVIRVNNCNIYNVGDVLVLDDSNVGKTYYDNNKTTKYIVSAKFIDSDDFHYIKVDKPYPTAKINSTEPSDNYTFKRYYYTDIIHLNELRIRGNPVMQKEQPYSYSNPTSISKYNSRDYEINGDFVNLADVKLLFDSITNEYAGTSEDSTKFIIPITLTHRFDFELLDIITITDSRITKLNNKKAIIVSKSYSSSNLLQYNYEALLIGDYEPSETNVTLIDTITYSPISFPTYDHTLNSDLNVNVIDDSNSIITVTTANYGIITALRIDRTSYLGFNKTNFTDGVNVLEMNLSGATKQLQ